MVFVWCLILIFKIRTNPNGCNYNMPLSLPWSSAVYNGRMLFITNVGSLHLACHKIPVYLSARI